MLFRSPVAVHGPLTGVASPSGGFSCCGAWAPGPQGASVVVVHGPSCSAACGILPDQGLNPCPPHWQAGSQPLCHQGSPSCIFLIFASILFPRSWIIFTIIILNSFSERLPIYTIFSCFSGVLSCSFIWYIALCLFILSIFL